MPQAHLSPDRPPPKQKLIVVHAASHAPIPATTVHWRALSVNSRRELRAQLARMTESERTQSMLTPLAMLARFGYRVTTDGSGVAQVPCTHGQQVQVGVMSDLVTGWSTFSGPSAEPWMLEVEDAKVLRARATGAGACRGIPVDLEWYELGRPEYTVWRTTLGTVDSGNTFQSMVLGEYIEMRMARHPNHRPRRLTLGVPGSMDYVSAFGYEYAFPGLNIEFRIDATVRGVLAEVVDTEGDKIPYLNAYLNILVSDGLPYVYPIKEGRGSIPFLVAGKRLEISVTDRYGEILSRRDFVADPLHPYVTLESSAHGAVAIRLLGPHGAPCEVGSTATIRWSDTREGARVAVGIDGHVSTCLPVGSTELRVSWRDLRGEVSFSPLVYGPLRDIGTIMLTRPGGLTLCVNSSGEHIPVATPVVRAWQGIESLAVTDDGAGCFVISADYGQEVIVYVDAAGFVPYRGQHVARGQRDTVTLQAAAKMDLEVQLPAALGSDLVGVAVRGDGERRVLPEGIQRDSGRIMARWSALPPGPAVIEVMSFRPVQVLQASVVDLGVGDNEVTLNCLGAKWRASVLVCRSADRASELFMTPLDTDPAFRYVTRVGTSTRFCGVDGKRYLVFGPRCAGGVVESGGGTLILLPPHQVRVNGNAEGDWSVRVRDREWRHDVVLGVAALTDRVFRMKPSTVRDLVGEGHETIQFPFEYEVTFDSGRQSVVIPPDGPWRITVPEEVGAPSDSRERRK